MPAKTTRETPTFAIRAATRGDLPIIAEIHRSAFAGFFLAEMGTAFLRAYYSLTLRYKGAVLLLAESEGTAVGFVTGFADPARFSRAMSRAKWRLLPAISWALVCNPRLIGRIVGNVRRVSRAETPPHAPSKDTCELASLGVRASAQGKGIGKALVAAFLDHAARLGATNVVLTTDATGNESANAFYCGLGFQQNRQFDRTSERKMNEYVYWISPEP